MRNKTTKKLTTGENKTTRVDEHINDLSLLIKGAQSRLNGLKSLAKLFNFVGFQSVSIFSIRFNLLRFNPCSLMFCYDIFGIIFRFPSI